MTPEELRKAVACALGEADHVAKKLSPVEREFWPDFVARNWGVWAEQSDAAIALVLKAAAEVAHREANRMLDGGGGEWDSAATVAGECIVDAILALSPPETKDA